jgi:hypothetical protein
MGNVSCGEKVAAPLSVEQQAQRRNLHAIGFLPLDVDFER